MWLNYCYTARKRRYPRLCTSVDKFRLPNTDFLFKFFLYCWNAHTHRIISTLLIYVGHLKLHVDSLHMLACRTHYFNWLIIHYFQLSPHIFLSLLHDYANRLIISIYTFSFCNKIRWHNFTDLAHLRRLRILIGFHSSKFNLNRCWILHNSNICNCDLD